MSFHYEVSSGSKVRRRTAKQSYRIIGLRGGEPGRRKLSTMVGKSKSDAIFSGREILFPKRASMKRRL
jgi:hypothetical protein